MIEIFRHCPGCGRRFHIKLEERRMIHDEKRIIPTKRVMLSTPGRYTMYSNIPPAPPAVMLEGKPIILEEKDFQYTYKCGHCGHEWTEHHQEEHREG